MVRNDNLHRAKTSKDDEYYTRKEDIENELKHYIRFDVLEENFKNKIVFCNCDDPIYSEFWKYFHKNFSALGIKKLIATHYKSDGNNSYKLEYMGGDDKDIKSGIKTELNGNGDFRSDECIEILKEADIIITNPPFSLFKEFVEILMKYDKKFLIIGNKNAVTYKSVFTYIKDGKIKMGISKPVAFITSDGSITKKTQGLTRWFTNLSCCRDEEQLDLYCVYSKEKYPFYDNYDAIEVSKVSEIPKDYTGIMGVPITFVDKYNPKQFEIIGSSDRGGDGFVEDIKKEHNRWDAPVLNGKAVYTRIFIKRRSE